MGRRSRRREATPAKPAPAPRPSREERAAEARARLKPLAEGERPTAVTVAVVVALVLAVVVVVGYFTGARLGDREPPVLSLVLLEVILLVAAAGMWRVRYWAVLGFQAFLAFQIIVAGLSLTVASNVWGVVLTVSVILGGGFLFWKLVRAMVRIQLPDHRRARR